MDAHPRVVQGDGEESSYIVPVRGCEGAKACRAVARRAEADAKVRGPKVPRSDGPKVPGGPRVLRSEGQRLEAITFRPDIPAVRLCSVRAQALRIRDGSLLRTWHPRTLAPCRTLAPPLPTLPPRPAPSRLPTSAPCPPPPLALSPPRTLAPSHPRAS